nr:unnamed protein product [Digitaria exilis]
MRKLPAGGSSRRSSQHGDAAHNLTEKRRRHKINEKLRTLQQLVPGCDDKASTLDQTIQYLKSLQHHIQAMSVVPSPVAPAIAMPMPPAAPMVLAPAAPAMGPFGGMLHLPGGHYPVDGLPVMMPAAAAAPLYPPAAPPRAAAPPPGGVRSSSTGHWQGSSSSCKGKGGSRSLRHQKH